MPSQDQKEQGGRPKALTSIHPRIHCGGYAEGVEPDHGGDLDSLMIDHFLDTLAEMAVAVASRACNGQVD